LLEDFIIPEAKNVNAFGGQGLGTGGIVLGLFGLGVLAAVEFEGQFGFVAVEVKDEAADGMLPPELGPAKLAITEQLPEQLFGVGGAAA
jgi:hypothetical protein